MDDQNEMKPLPNVLPALSPPPKTSSVRVLLDERIDLTEAIALAGKIIGSYPNADKVSDSYQGAVAHTLGTYPASVARQCADLSQGIVRYAKFMPSVAEIVNYCEGYAEPLRRQWQWDDLAAKQIEQRVRDEIFETQVRPQRLTLAELKEKYGDWNHGFRKPGEYEREIKQKAYDSLVKQFGKAAIDAVPDAKPINNDPFEGL